MRIKSSFGFSIKPLPKKARIQLSLEKLYLLLYGSYGALYIIDQSLLDIHLIMRLYMLLSAGALFLIFFIKQRLPLKKICIASVIMVTFTVAAIVTDRTNFIIFSLFIITADVTKFNKIVKCSLIFTCSSVLLVAFCSQVGIIPDYIFVHKGMEAHCLGYSYYAVVPYTLMFNMLSYLYLRGKDINILELAFLLVCNRVIYSFSTTRLTYYIFLIVIVLFIVIVKADVVKNYDKSAFEFLAVIAFPMAFGVTNWCAVHYNPNSRFWRNADDWVNNRLSLSHKAFEMYDVKLLGQYIEMNGNAKGNTVTSSNYFYIDSAYVYIVLGYGLLFTIILLGGYCFLIWYSCKSNNKRMLVWSLALVGFSVINNSLTGIFTNPLLLFLLMGIKEIERFKIIKINAMLSNMFCLRKKLE